MSHPIGRVEGRAEAQSRESLRQFAKSRTLYAVIKRCLVHIGFSEQDAVHTPT